MFEGCDKENEKEVLLLGRGNESERGQESEETLPRQRDQVERGKKNDDLSKEAGPLQVIRENDTLYFVFEYMKENLYQLMKERWNPFYDIGEGFQKQKWKFKMAFAMKERGGRGSRVRLRYF